jgi:tetratricopeptide (TPR) repeat protein
MRRLLVLATGFFLIVGALGAVFIVKQRHLNAKIREEGAQGMREYAAGDFEGARRELFAYLKQRPRDVDAVYAFGVASTKVPTTDGSNIRDAMQAFRRYLDMKPDDDHVQHLLLDLFVDVQDQDSEAIRMAGVILQHNPHDLDAYKAMAIVNGRNRQQYEASLKACELYLQIDPSNLDIQEQALRVMIALHKPRAEVLKRAADYVQAHPNDPRYQLVAAMSSLFESADPAAPADQRAADSADGIKSLNTALAQPAPDSKYVLKVVGLLDQLGRFNDSRRILQEAADALHDKTLDVTYAQRLWQEGRCADVIKRTNGIDIHSADSQMLAIITLALNELHQDSSAQLLVNELSKRTGDPVAVAWSTALQARLAVTPNSDRRYLLTQYQKALTSDPGNAIIRYLVGEAYLSLGELDLAAQQWRTAAAQVPSWSLPHVRIAQLLAAGGALDKTDLNREAGRGLRAEPSLAAAAMAAFARYDQAVASGDPQDLRKVLVGEPSRGIPGVQTIQTAVPGEPETLPLYVTLLNDTGAPNDALAAIDQAMKPGPNQSENLLLGLARVSHSKHLGREDALLELSEKTYGLTPKLAVARALLMLDDNKPPSQALDYLQAAARTGIGEKSVWALSITQLQEETNPNGATAAWVALGDAYPNDLLVQDTILKASSAWADRDFIGRTVQRVHDLTGDDGINWRVGRARWLLGSSNPKTDSAEAIVILTHVIETAPGQIQPRVLLATALENVGNTAGAIDQLHAANDLSPRNPGIVYQLCRLLGAAARPDESRTYATELTTLPYVPADMLRSAAKIMSAQGNNDLALQLVQRIPGNSDDAAQQAQVAFLYWHQGKISDAATIYFKLLDASLHDPDAVRQIADFFASQNDMPRARQALGQLDSLNLPPSRKQLLVADFDDKFGDIAGAKTELAAATAAAPTDPAVWQALIGLHIRHGEIADARNAVADAIKANPANQQFKDLRDRLAAASAVTMTPNTTALLSVLTYDPGNDAAAQTLQLLMDNASHKLDDNQAAQKLADLADKYPKFFPIYPIAVDQFVRLNNVDRALAMAKRAEEAIPESVQAAQLLTTIYGMTQQWNNMNLAAQQWRQHSLDQPMNPDVAIAISDLGMGNGTAAVNTLEPYRSFALKDPAGNKEFITTYARALIGAAREDDAAALLRPLASADSQWRLDWMRLATLTHGDAASASAWLTRVVPLVPVDSPAEQSRLADAWYGIGARFNNADAFKTAKDMLQNLIGKPGVSSDSIMTLASAMEMTDDFAGAQAMYRRVLAAADAAPERAPAQNNLAYLLLVHGQPTDLPEAESLARAAVASAPNDPQTGSYYDTLARIYVKEGKQAQGEKTFETAQRLQPWNVDIMMALSDSLVQLHQPDKALYWVGQIDTDIRTRGLKLSPDQQQQLSALRQSATTRPAGAAVSGTGN